VFSATASSGTIYFFSQHRPTFSPPDEDGYNHRKQDNPSSPEGYSDPETLNDQPEKKRVDESC
jgi:hypothetical protein